MSDDPWAAFNPQPAPVASPPPAADPWAAFNPQPAAAPAADGAADEHPLTVHRAVAPQAQSVPAVADPGLWGTIKDQAGQAAQAADDIVRLTANGMTLGYADKLAALGNGDTAEQERQKTAAAQGRSGWAGTVAQGAGMMAPAGVAGKIASGIGAAAEAVPVVGRIIANPWTQAAVSGAGVGAGDAAGHDQDPAMGALVGAGAGVVGKGVGDAVSGVVGKVAGVVNPKPSIPSTDELKSAAQAAYQAADDAGVIINPNATTRLSDLLRNDMTDYGYQPAMQPKAAGVLSALDQMSGQNVTLKGLDTLRQVTNRLREGDPSEAELGRRLVNRIDAFTGSLKPADIVTGDMKTGVKALNDARSLWQKTRKSEALNEAVDSAKLRAASTGSGGNVDNATRQNVRRLLQSRDNWTADERQAMLDVLKGTPSQNALRLLGKLSPHGNGLMAALNIGAAMANPLLGVPGLAGAVSKHAADAATQRSVGLLDQLIRAGGDASSLAPVPNALQRLAQSKRGALANLLTGTAISAGRPAWAQ